MTLPSAARPVFQAPPRPRQRDLFRLRRIPGGIRFMRRHGVKALLRTLFPQLRSYRSWIRLYDTITENDRAAILAAVAAMADPPLISVVMPVYETPERFLRQAIDSVCRQLYPHWELCIADDASPSPHIRAILDEYRAREPRIKICYRAENGHISAASNSALALATGSFVALFDHDDLLPEHALYLVAAALAENPELDLIFSDEDKIDAAGNRFDPYFKSDWNPDLMLAQNAFSHLGVYRRSLLEEIGGFRAGYEGSQDYDLVLRASRRTRPERIRHIPHILYHWRAIPGSVALQSGEKDYAIANARRALVDHVGQCAHPASVAASQWPDYHRVRYAVPQPRPLVSLIVPTGGRTDLLRTCVTGLLSKTGYDNIELIVLYNSDTRVEVFPYLDQLSEDPRVTIVDSRSNFNFSRICNIGVARARGELVGLINDDLEVIHPDWLDEMVAHAVRPEVGAVGAKLYYPDDTVQHAGVIVGLGGGANHVFKFARRNQAGYFGRLMVTQNLSAVTAACMLLRRQVFEEVGGLDEVNLPIAFNDVDLCLRLRERGYLVVWTPYAELYHWESVSRGNDLDPDKVERFRREVTYLTERWRAVIERDPYYNPNLATDALDSSLAFPPRIGYPWRAAQPTRLPRVSPS